MNIVKQTKQKIEIEATKAKLKAYFTQTNHGNFACTSRVYLAPIDQPVYNCNSKSVIECWEFNQAQDKGVTERCERFKIYKEVLDHLLELNKRNIIKPSFNELEQQTCTITKNKQ